MFYIHAAYHTALRTIVRARTLEVYIYSSRKNLTSDLKIPICDHFCINIIYGQHGCLFSHEKKNI